MKIVAAPRPKNSAGAPLTPHSLSPLLQFDFISGALQASEQATKKNKEVIANLFVQYSYLAVPLMCGVDTYRVVVMVPGALSNIISKIGMNVL